MLLLFLLFLIILTLNYFATQMDQEKKKPWTDKQNKR